MFGTMLAQRLRLWHNIVLDVSCLLVASCNVYNLATYGVKHDELLWFHLKKKDIIWFADVCRWQSPVACVIGPGGTLRN